MGCLCKSKSPLGEGVPTRMGEYHGLRASIAEVPTPHVPRTGGGEQHGRLNSTATNARQSAGPRPAPPMHAAQANLAPVGAMHADSVQVARSGLALMAGTVFRQAVQYVRPSAPNVAPVRHYSLLTINDVLRPDQRALEQPRYHFAVIDSEQLLVEAKLQAKAAVRNGQR